MRDYAVVPAKFWITPLAKSLRGNPSAQVVALYLKTGPHANMIGLYHCPVGYIAQDTGIPLEGASKALASLSEGGYCEYDADAEVVFVRDMAEEQIGESLLPTDKRVKAVIKQWQACSSDALQRAFHSRYVHAFALPPIEAASKPNRGSIEGSAKPLQSPFEGSTGIALARVEGPSKPHGSQEQETDHEQDHSVPFGTGAAGAAGTASAIQNQALAMSALEAVAIMRRTEGDPLTEEDEKLLWAGGRALFALSNIGAENAAKFFGKLIKDNGNDRAIVFDVLRAACLERPIDPRGWMTAACQSRRGQRVGTNNKQTALEEQNQAAANAFANGNY